MTNKYIFRKNWECDLFCVSKSGYCVEVEMKMSRGDFRADFAKAKHKMFTAMKSGRRYLVEKVCEREDYTRIQIHSFEVDSFPNRFYFSCPSGLIKENEVPDYAGLIYTDVQDESPFGSIIKTAPFIHKRKLDLPKLLFDKYRWGYAQQAIDLQLAKYSLQNAEEKVENLRKQVPAIDLIALEHERMEWSRQIFTDATAIAGLRKLEEESKEIEKDINAGIREPEEYADALMCLFDSGARHGISPEEIVIAFQKKLHKNKYERTWSKNQDNTYSHVKSNS